MINETGQELRRIRITLVIIAILMLFTGDRTLTIDDDSFEGNTDFNLYHSNMVPLGDGYFGVLTSDTDDIEKTMKVYFFDKEKKQIIFINQKELDDLE